MVQDVDEKQSPESTAPQSTAVVQRAFGEENRSQLIQTFLTTHSGQEHWKAVYQLLLWVDKTTGLARCYESDKCQPGKPWHPRALRFHDWLSTQFGHRPLVLGEDLDWLFRKVADDYARYMVLRYQQLLVRAQQQRAPYANRNFPVPGDDPDIVALVREVLGTHLSGEPTHEQWRSLTTRIREQIGLENKRKNIVGEGFEDVLAAVVRRATPHGALDVSARRLLHTIPGFENKMQGAKPTKVDLAVIRAADSRRILVTVKWSTRADREEQFLADYQKYLQARSQAVLPFDYVLVTNEFDPARLKRACELSSGHSPLLTHVVHICPDALKAVYGEQPEQTMREVVDYIDSGRILGLDRWIAGLTPSNPARH